MDVILVTASRLQCWESEGVTASVSGPGGDSASITTFDGFAEELLASIQFTPLPQVATCLTNSTYYCKSMQ